MAYCESPERFNNNRIYYLVWMAVFFTGSTFPSNACFNPDEKNHNNIGNTECLNKKAPLIGQGFPL